jgi:hypothetical protein
MPWTYSQVPFGTLEQNQARVAKVDISISAAYPAPIHVEIMKGTDEDHTESR